MSSLADQLLKAGLVDKKKAKQVKQEQKKQKRQQKNQKDVVDEVKVAAAKARHEKTERDRQLNKERKAQAERKAIAAQIIQLIKTNRQSRGEQGKDDIAYNFTDGKQIKKIYVSAEVQRQLINARLVIAKLNDHYELIPSLVADKICQRDDSYIVSRAATNTEVDGDDPYADYQIPDDLMW